MQLAKAIQNSLVGIGFRNRGVKVGNFHVLRETYSPAVLLEVGLISNVNDNKLFEGLFRGNVYGKKELITEKVCFYVLLNLLAS